MASAVSPTALIVRPAPLVLRPIENELTLGDYVRQYILEHRISRKYEHAITRSVRQLEQFAGCQIPLGTLSSNLVNAWLLDMEQSATIAPVSVKGKRINILTLWRAAFEAGIIDHEPKRIRKISAPLKTPVAWSIDELTTLLEAASAVHGTFTIAPVAKSVFWLAFIRTAFDTGLRLSDLWNLKSDLRLGDGRFFVEQHKTGNRVQCLLQPETLNTIRAYISARPRLSVPRLLGTQDHYGGSSADCPFRWSSRLNQKTSQKQRLMD